MLWYYIYGYGFSISVGLLIGLVTDAMRGGEPGRGWQTRMQGSVEQVLYTSLVLMRQPVFIALWLAVKTAVQWQDWAQHKDRSSLFDRYLSPYLVGNALSIIVAVTGGKIVDWSARGHYLAWLAPVAVGFGILSLFLWAEYRGKKDKKVS